jgi:hypothetical protein
MAGSFVEFCDMTHKNIRFYTQKDDINLGHFIQ